MSTAECLCSPKPVKRHLKFLARFPKLGASPGGSSEPFERKKRPWHGEEPELCLRPKDDPRWCLDRHAVEARADQAEGLADPNSPAASISRPKRARSKVFSESVTSPICQWRAGRRPHSIDYREFAGSYFSKCS